LKDASEAAMFYERVAANLLEGAPPWLLFYTLAAVTREILSRRVQQGIVPSLVNSDPAARKKAMVLAKQFRGNFDNRIQDALRPGAYSNAENFIRRIVDADREIVFSDLGGVVSTELAQAFRDVIEAESQGRIQRAIGEAAELNQTSAEKDLADIMTRADGDGNEMITADELWELIFKEPIIPAVAPLAQQWPVLKSVRSAANSWEMFTSLLMAPQIKRLSQVANIVRGWCDRNVDRPVEKAREHAEGVVHDARASVIENLREALPDYAHLLPDAHYHGDSKAKVLPGIVLEEIPPAKEKTLSRRQKVLKWLHHRCPWKWGIWKRKRRT
jgi:hypothetical protein